MKLSIIIVNYNVKEFLQNLLYSIQKSATYPETEVIVVDNASDDGSIEMLREKFPNVFLIANKDNIGFGSANNQGLKIARGKYILLINPDTIVQENTFEKMIGFFEKTPEAGLAGCKILNSDGTLQLACRRSFPGPWTSFTKVSGLSRIFSKSRLFARYNLTYLDENKTYEVDAISGAFMFMRKEVYDKIGGFDPQFFMYGEDLDLCFRTQKSGYKVFYVHNTSIIHYKGESTKRSKLDETIVFYDAMHLFVKKHLSSSFLVQIILRFAIFLRTIIAFLNIYKLPMLAVIFDFIFYDIAIYLADKVYSSAHWHGFPKETLLTIFIIPALIQIIIGMLTGAYRKDSISILRILYSILIGFFILSSVTFFFNEYAYSRAIILISYGFLFVLFPLWRVIIKSVFKVGIIEDYNKTRTLVIGTNKDSLNLAQKLEQKFTSIHNVIGLIGLNRKSIGEKINNHEVIGSIENIRKVIRDNKINEVIFSSGEISYNQMLSVVSECQGENVDFKVAGDEMDFLVGKSSITILDDIPLLEINYNITDISHILAKTILDYVIAIPVLILLFPLIYFFRKVSSSKSDFINFICNIPSVVTGKKSLVGPFNTKQKELYLGKQGLTGLWYTEDYKKNDEEIAKLDIFYAKNQNIWLDLEILGKSFSKMFK